MRGSKTDSKAACTAFNGVRGTLPALGNRGAGLFSFGLLFSVGLLGCLQLASNLLLVFVLLGVVLFEFLRRIDHGLPLMQITSLIAVLQWTVGPILAFRTDLVEGRYGMYVNEFTYFQYALPGTVALVLGLLTLGKPVQQRELLANLDPSNFLTVGLILNAIALAGAVGGRFVPGGLSFAFFLLSQLRYVGALYFLFSKSIFRWPLVLVSLLPLFAGSAEFAMFHDLLLWVSLLFCYWFAMRPRSLSNKMAFVIAAALGVFTIQGIKGSYRDKVWFGEEASIVEEVTDFWSTPAALTGNDLLANVISRLNQGWIISAVMNHVPEYEPYAGGETVKEALVASLLPRIASGDKAKSGGQVNFMRFTGLLLGESTSMAISPLGEAYANFGVIGGISFMLIFGLGFSGFYALCIKWSMKHVDFLFWIPMIFYQAIKAETELVTVLNQLTKGGIVAFGLYWLICIKIFPSVFSSKRNLSEVKTCANRTIS